MHYLRAVMKDNMKAVRTVEWLVELMAVRKDKSLEEKWVWHQAVVRDLKMV